MRSRIRRALVTRLAPGFALPAVLTMLLLLSLLAAAGHALSTLELRTSETHRHSVAAFYLADGALQELLGEARGWPPAARSFSFPDGLATVSSRSLIRLPGGQRVFRVVSRAALSPSGGGWARKAVGTLVVAGAPVQPPGALLALGTLEADGGSGRLDGRDVAPDPGCPPTGAQAGLAVLAGSAPSLPADIAVEGDPPVLLLADAAQARVASAIDWPALLGPHGPEPTVRLPGGEAHEPATGDASDGWPVVRIDGPFRLDASHSGSGAILASGPLELAAGFTWDGLVLVEGSLHLSGPVTVFGGVAAGLGALVGREAGSVTTSGGGIRIEFHSCNVASAAASLALPPAARPGTWFEELEEWF